MFSDDQVCLEFDPDYILRFQVLDEDLLGKSPVAFADEKHRYDSCCSLVVQV